MAQTWAEVQALGLTAPEQALVAACRAGEDCVLGDGTRPEGPEPARTVRAEVLRFMILGGDADCPAHARGVRLKGAFVSGTLDLAFAQAQGQTVLRHCRFEAQPNLPQARLQLLSLGGSFVPGLMAEGVQVAGGVHLNDGFVSRGYASLSGATIDGQLACTGGRFEAARDSNGTPVGIALNADGTRVRESVSLRNGFEAKGEVRLCGATIHGQLDCTGGRFTAASESVNEPVAVALNAEGAQVTGQVFLCDGFEAVGEVCLASATIGGQLACDNGRFAAARDGAGKPVGMALNGQRMRTTGSFFFRKVSVETGNVSLTSATVGDLVDDLKSWPEAGRLDLDGFTYERIAGSFTDSQQRLDWLARGTAWNGAFHPQPYAQLAKVLRAMGHDRAARDVLVEQARLIAWHDRARLRAQPLADRDGFDRLFGVHTVRARAAALAVWDTLVRWVVGYGYKPFRSLVALALLWAFATTPAHLAWASGAMVPNSGVILTSAGWLDLADRPDAAQVWAAGAGADWETFSALAWGLDLVVPILDLGQVAAWAPSTARGPWGTGLWWARWLLIGAGWVVAGLAAAAVTGIIRRA